MTLFASRKQRGIPLSLISFDYHGLHSYQVQGTPCLRSLALTARFGRLTSRQGFTLMFAYLGTEQCPWPRVYRTYEERQEYTLDSSI